MSRMKLEQPDWFLDSALRPDNWNEYVGQKNLKENLRILLRAARERSQPPEHLLFYGPAGLGKTTLAYLVAKESGAPIKNTSGPAIEKVGDLASILTNLSSGDILFIDEIHRLNKSVEEVLYPAMEAGVLNIVIGKGPGARIIQLDLPPFTLIGATTRIALLSSPLRSRFSGGVYRLEFYAEEEIEEVINRSANILKVKLSRAAGKIIAQRSRFVPRVANQLLKRCRDFAQIQKKPLSVEVAEAALALLGVDELGLTESDRHLLRTIAEKFNGGPVGINTLTAATLEEPDTIEEVYEPHLIRFGLLERTPRGRVVTRRGYDHLRLPSPSDQQDKLI